jgi:hypothetical protein
MYESEMEFDNLIFLVKDKIYAIGSIVLKKELF